MVDKIKHSTLQVGITHESFIDFVDYLDLCNIFKTSAMYDRRNFSVYAS